MSRDYDSTVARIAGNLAPAIMARDKAVQQTPAQVAAKAVALAREIVTEVRATESQGKGVAVRELNNPLLGYERILELCHQFGIVETDDLKHRLEDQERWGSMLRQGFTLRKP